MPARAAAERAPRPGPPRTARRDLLRHRLARFDPLVAQHRLATQPDAVAVDFDHLHQDLLAFLDLVLDLLDAVLGDLGDVQQPLQAGKDLHEGSEVGDARDLPEIGLARLGLRGDLLDDIDRLHGRALVHRGDVDAGVVLHVDPAAGPLDDRLDHPSARADHLADLVLVDADREDARRARGDVRARLRARRVHDIKDVHARLARLAQGLLHDRLVDAVDLDVHL